MSHLSNVIAAALIVGLPTQPSAMTLGLPVQDIAPLQVQLIEDEGGPARINLSGKLRMLSQRIAASACNAAAGIAVDQSGPMLQSASAEFTRIVAALRYGDEALGVPNAEDDRKVQADIKALREIWDPMQAQIEAVADRSIDASLAADLAAQSAPLLEQAKLLVSRESAEYSDPAALLQADAMLIDIAGRQRMLAQRISKNVCLAQEGESSALTELQSAMETYAASLMALRNGMAEVGILPPPTESIAQGLDEIIEDWTALQPILAQVLAGTRVDDAERAALYLAANGLTGKMNVLVGEYEAASKRGL